MTMSTVLFVDLENEMTDRITLRKMTLRQYLAAAPIRGCGYAVDRSKVYWISADSDEWPAFVEWLKAAAEDPDVIFVAHNSAFDIRDLRFGWTRKWGPLRIPQPHRVRCSLELAYAAWPNQPGAPRITSTGTGTGDERDPHAYSLQSLAVTLGLGLNKLDMATDDIGEYCIRDVELCRMIYDRAVARLPESELDISELAQRARELYLEIDGSKVSTAIDSFDAAARTSANDALALLGTAGEEVFGSDTATGRVRSVKPHKLRRVLLDRLGFDAPTTSLKKLNPRRLAESADAAAVLKATGDVNKVLSHRRRVSVFAGVDVVDVEMGYARAHTFRYSSPSVGKGLNLHNIPKRNKVLAKAIRMMYRLPAGYCFVSADLANVEYRGSGWLTNCGHIKRLFSTNVLADPYIAFWLAATGQAITKGHPARQVAKAAVLGLTYLMGLARWMVELMHALADPELKLTIADFERIADEQRWTLDRYGRDAQGKTHAPSAVARVAQGMHNAFHTVHPELRAYAQWLEGTVIDASRALDPQRAIDLRYRVYGAPDLAKCELRWEDTADLERSVRSRLGNWDALTVTWRDVGTRMVGFDGGAALSSRQAGSKGYRVLSKNVLIENEGQGWGRNVLVAGKRALAARGWPYLLSIHDQVQLVVPKDRLEIERARADLLAVFGPGNGLGYGWAAVVNPDEIDVSQTLYDAGQDAAWWRRLAAGDETLLETL